MKRCIFLFVITIVFILQCTKETERIIEPSGNTGTIVGAVLQKSSNAKVIIRQAAPVDSVMIDSNTGIFRFEDVTVGNYNVSIEADGFGITWIYNVDVIPDGSTYVGDISLSTFPNEILSFYPTDESEIVFDRRFSRITISVEFTKPMDRASVEAAFSTDPPSEGIFYWGTFASGETPNYYWDDAARYSNSGGTITTYSKINSFTYRMAQKDGYTDTTYTIRLAETATDTAGNPMRFPLEFTFSTVQSSQTQNAILTQPEHGAIYVEPMSNSSLYIYFPRRMDAATTEAAVSISPATDATFLWPESEQLKIFTGGPLYAGTVYTITVDASAEDLDGIPLGEDFTFSFETAGLEVSNTYPQNGEIFVDRDEPVQMYFNSYMDLSSVRDAFTIQPAISGSFQRGTRYSTSTKNAVTFTPGSAYQKNTKYTVTISTAAKDLHGTALMEPYTFTFVTSSD